MALKETFLTYVELQRTANVTRDQYGAMSIQTVEAYQKANELKRKILDIIEEKNL